MAKASRALAQFRPESAAYLKTLGADLAAARLSARESIATRAKRMQVSKGALERLEAGDPAVAIGIVATALRLIERDSRLADLATAERGNCCDAPDVQEGMSHRSRSPEP